jgi:purine nucleoside permease
MKTWKTATRTLLAAGLTALCLTSHLAQADDKEGMREREGLAPKVMIISMFGPEGQVWLDKLGPWRDVAVPGLSPDYPTVHCNKAAVCVMTTGYLGINTKALRKSPRWTTAPRCSSSMRPCCKRPTPCPGLCR